MTNFIEETLESFDDLFLDHHKLEGEYSGVTMSFTKEEPVSKDKIKKWLEQTLLQHRASVIEEVKGVMGGESEIKQYCFSSDSEEATKYNLINTGRNEYRQEMLEILNKML